MSVKASVVENNKLILYRFIDGLTFPLFLFYFISILVSSLCLREEGYLENLIPWVSCGQSLCTLQNFSIPHTQFKTYLLCDIKPHVEKMGSKHS